MQDFLDDLERRLTTLAAGDAPAPTPARAPRNFRRRRPAFLGALTALLAAGAAAFTMTGTSLADLPILDTDTQDASEIESEADAARAAGVDFSKAHVFGTPGGPGYALVNPRTDTMCLVVPDPDAAGTFGQSCEPIADVERRGMSAELSGDTDRDPSATSLVVFVLPEDAEDAVVTIRGRRATSVIKSGIVVFQTPARAVLSWTVDGVRAERAFAAPFRSTGAGYVCPDGRQVTGRPAPAGLTPEEANDFLKQQRKLLCR